MESVINTVCKHKALGPGAIILCHNGAKYTADALDRMLTNLEEQGNLLRLHINYSIPSRYSRFSDDQKKSTCQIPIERIRLLENGDMEIEWKI